MNTPMHRVALILTLLIAAASNAHAKVYRVYYLGGQSNMDGYGLTEQLTEEQQAPVEGCMIYRGTIQRFGDEPKGLGAWATLEPGFGVGYSSDGFTNRFGNRFGPELRFGAQMQELRPGEHIAIIKYSCGGSSLSVQTGGATWDVDDRRRKNEHVGINQFDHALKTIDEAMRVRDIDGDGEEDTLIPAGIVWMQGESDGTNEAAAEAYEQNLTELMDLLRAALRVDDLPVVIGRISDSGVTGGGEPVWKWGETIRAAQLAYCKKDPSAILVSATDRYDYSDPYHYDTAGYLDLGKRFAEAMHALEESME
ncbi:MAG: sialate O-acetylesterase [Phycisphaerales bacterium JB047]